MPDAPRSRRFTVLIDADNTSSRIAAGLFEEIARFGEATVRRIYGDFSSTRQTDSRTGSQSSRPPQRRRR
jgi:hypothetical protein